MLEEIRRELQSSRDETREIPASRVRNWMSSKDPDVLGATYGFFHSAHTGRIRPKLSFDEIFDFTLAYYEWCIRTDPPPGRWASTRYSAGWDLASWFFVLWDQKRDKKYFDRIKLKLEQLYESGDADLKQAIEHAIVEHLFERKAIRKFFANWKNDPQMKAAYEEGMLWITRGGTSPLSETPKERAKPR